MARHIEDNQQIAVVTWFRQMQTYGKIPEHYILAHNNNSTQYLDTFAKRNLWGKRGGVKAIPDLVLYVGTEMWHGFFIEMKSESHRPKKTVDDHWWLEIKPDANGKETTSYGVTSTQSVVMCKLVQSGYKCEVCFSAQDAIKLIESYLGIEV